MQAFIPYLVLLGIVVLFFAVCYFVFRESPQKSSGLSESHRERRRQKIRQYAEGTVSAQSLQDESKKEKSPHRMDSSADKIVAVEAPDSIPEANLYSSVSVHEGTPEAMTLVIPPLVEEGVTTVSAAEVKQEVPVNDENTQAIPILSKPINDVDQTAPTTILRRDELSEALANQGLMESNPIVDKDDTIANNATSWKEERQGEECLSIALQPFIHVFGVISDRTREVVSEVTNEALQALGIQKKEEIEALLDNIVVQEALLLMQKSYAANPSSWMKPLAIDAFVDVVTEPKSSTPYLVAYDALKILSHLSLAHVQVLSLVLLLQYSRNTNNYNLEYFRHYVDKYIKPFVSDLPRNLEVYRQLDYLRCTQKETEKLTLAQLLSNSYSFVFNFRGFSKEDLHRVLDGEHLSSRFVVKSINSSLYKLALVDQGMAPQFFRQAHISDARLQNDLLQLMQSKPSAFSGTEARRVMEEISPTLLDLADLFDQSPMATMSLSLLGLYLGKLHVKATIHENFDLSQWF